MAAVDFYARVNVGFQIAFGRVWVRLLGEHVTRDVEPYFDPDAMVASVCKEKRHFLALFYQSTAVENFFERRQLGDFFEPDGGPLEYIIATSTSDFNVTCLRDVSDACSSDLSDSFTHSVCGELPIEIVVPGLGATAEPEKVASLEGNKCTQDADLLATIEDCLDDDEQTINDVPDHLPEESVQSNFETQKQRLSLLDVAIDEVSTHPGCIRRLLFLAAEQQRRQNNVAALESCEKAVHEIRKVNIGTLSTNDSNSHPFPVNKNSF